MNRLALAAENISAPVSFPLTHGLIDVITFAARPAIRRPDDSFATFAPIHYEPGYAYPLLVWLHSAGGDQHELPDVMPHVSMRNYVAIAPRGSSAHPRRPNRYGWRQSQHSIETADAAVSDCIASAERQFNIHPERRFLIGRGGGGTMALRIAWNDPGRYAGVVSINGPLPKRWRPMQRVNELRQVPCLLITLRDSRNYAPRQVCSDLRLLHAAGCTVALRQYPGCDELTRDMLADLNRWLMHLVCGGTHDG